MNPVLGIRLRVCWIWIASLLIAFLAGCAQPKLQGDAVSRRTDSWSGRMALTVDGKARESFSAMFALEGSTERGHLALSSPLGTVLADLVWEPDGAELTTPQGKYAAESLDALVLQALGSPVPIDALFAWLQGDAVTTSGWEADLSHLSNGRLVAVREQPLPKSTLRLILD